MNPARLCFPIVMMFRIPPVPSASYLAPGSVITSIFLIVAAGMDFSTVFTSPESIGSSLPFTRILKLELPFTFMLSSASTVTIGTFLNISIVVLIEASGSSSTLYVRVAPSLCTSFFFSRNHHFFKSFIVGRKSYCAAILVWVLFR